MVAKVLLKVAEHTNIGVQLLAPLRKSKKPTSVFLNANTNDAVSSHFVYFEKESNKPLKK